MHPDEVRPDHKHLLVHGIVGLFVGLTARQTARRPRRVDSQIAAQTRFTRRSGH